MNAGRIGCVLFLLLLMSGCGAGDSSEDYASRVNQSIETGKFEQAQELILEWAEVKPEDRKKIKPYHTKLLRARRGAPAGAGGISQTKFNHLLVQAAIDGDVVKVNELFATNPDKPVEASDGGHPLLLAAAFGKTDVLAALLDNGVDIDHQDSTGMTALMSAVMRKQEEAVQFLLNAGADVHRQTTGERKKSAISLAETSGHASIQEAINKAATEGSQ